MIRKLADDEVKFNLALSLHAADDKKRDEIMPINEQNNLEVLMESLEYFYQKTHNRISYEYIAFQNYNESIEDAKKLCFPERSGVYLSLRRTGFALTGATGSNSIILSKYTGNSVTQTWSYKSFRIKMGQTNLCLTSSGLQVDSKAILATCNTSDQKQKIQINWNGEVRVVGTDLCLENPCSDPFGCLTNGNVLRFGSCVKEQNNPRQVWSVL